jgi:hypothetical protein
LLFSNTQIGILGKRSIPSESLTAKFNAIQLFVLNKNDMHWYVFSRVRHRLGIGDHWWSTTRHKLSSLSIISSCPSGNPNIHLYNILFTWFIDWTLILIAMKELPRRVSLVVHELLTLLEHLSSPGVFSGVRATRCLVDCCLSYFCWSLYYLSLDLRNCITHLASSNSS